MDKMSRKLSVYLCFGACLLHLGGAFMKIADFYEADLARCYDWQGQDPRRVSDHNVNGQALPLPSSVEAFAALLEKYEARYPGEKPGDLASKLLQSFRIDDMDSDLQDRALRDPGADMLNDMKRALLGVGTQAMRYQFRDGDFSGDERCALHLMLSHTLNDTKVDGEEVAEFDKNKAKRPIEVGVVSLGSKWNVAFALGRVLLGVSAGFLSPKEIGANRVLQLMKKEQSQKLNDVKLNPVFAVTLGDLVSRLAPKKLDDDILLLPNGIWDDVVCPIAYKLKDNNNGFVTKAELRGAIDGLHIGKAIQEDQATYNNLKLSQILRMYYGSAGLLDNQNTKWCNHKAPNTISEFNDEMVSFFKLFKVANGGDWSEKINEQVNRAVTEISNEAFNKMDIPECSFSESSQDRIKSPLNIFVIMDSTPSKSQFQREVIGNLSANFDFRPHGNLMGLFTNIKASQQNTLETVVKSNGVAGCPACFAKYYSKQSTRKDEAEVFRDLNATLTNFEEEHEKWEELDQEPKAASPGKVILYFNFGSPSEEYRIQESLWFFKQYFGGATILAVGDNKASLKQFVVNEQTDIFTGSNVAEKTAKDIKDRLKNVPGEFHFKDCYQSSQTKEAENRQVGYISPNKMQYWAMYPQYFLKSFGINLKFKAQEGTSISVCFTRWFPNFIDRKPTECKTSNGEEVSFYLSDPCKKKSVYNCEPFFFSVEAKKPTIEPCKSLYCSTPKDIQFEFQHDGISCNMASMFSLSNLALLLATVAWLWLQRH